MSGDSQSQPRKADSSGGRDLLQNPPTIEEIFPYDTPYDNQRDGIEETIETAENSGFTILEGACGTGKTLIALTAGCRLIRDPSTKYTRLMVLTSVKQQLRQFESDLRRLNLELPDGIGQLRGLSLQGKADLCPYQLSPESDMTSESCNARCEELRSQTTAAAHGNEQEYGSLAEKAAQAAQGSADGPLKLGDIRAPFKSELAVKSGSEYCPFYANIQSQGGDPHFSFDAVKDSVLDVPAMLKLATEAGVCPHSAMTSLIGRAEVVMCNYYHAFDRDTLQLTHHIIDENTFVICDEAHRLEPRVRDIFSTEVSLGTVEYARRELAQLLDALETPDSTTDMAVATSEDLYGEASDLAESMSPLTEGGVRNVMAEEDVFRPHLEYTFDFLGSFTTAAEQSAYNLLDKYHDGWRDDLSQLHDGLELPLRNPAPEEPQRDGITKWLENGDWDEDAWERVARIAENAAEVSRILNTDGDAALIDAAEICFEWGKRDHTNYFREITLSRRDAHYYDGVRQYFGFNLLVSNCFPRAGIRHRLDSFGGGLLMSATLRPLDAYQDLIGISYLEDEGHREVNTLTYDNDFPPENRASWIVPLTKYTYSNRDRARDEYWSGIAQSLSIAAMASSSVSRPS